MVNGAGLRMQVATAGSGPAVLLLHGIPHTGFLWRQAMTALADRYFVVAPDLRGLGGTERATTGYDVKTLAGDLVGLLDALGVDEAAVVGIDLGVQTAFALALTAAERVRGLCVMEGLLGTLPGAESFFARGAPWWFGFHAVFELPETLLVGHEAEYVDFFLANGTYERRGVPTEARDAFVRAYTGRESIRCLCEHYRAMPESARQLAELVKTRRLEMPTFAIAGGIVGEALAGQLRALTNNLQTAQVDRASHILPEERPEEVLALLETFLAGCARLE